ncbi:MAG: hypothetical protein NVS3B26_04560 [Mycobacteriales bacterium]
MDHGVAPQRAPTNAVVPQRLVDALARPIVILGGHVAARRRSRRVDEQSQRRLNDLALPKPVTDGPDRPAHDVGSDEHPRHLQTARYVSERADEDRHGGDPGRLEGPADESDRPVTDRSSSHEQAGVDAFGVELLGPLRGRLLT